MGSALPLRLFFLFSLLAHSFGVLLLLRLVFVSNLHHFRAKAKRGLPSVIVGANEIGEKPLEPDYPSEATRLKRLHNLLSLVATDGWSGPRVLLPIPVSAETKRGI